MFGSEAKEVIDFSQKGKFDLIIIGARGRDMIKQMLLGSVSNTIVHSSKIHVTAIK